jgi:hypothetical protein
MHYLGGLENLLIKMWLHFMLHEKNWCSEKDFGFIGKVKGSIHYFCNLFTLI